MEDNITYIPALPAEAASVALCFPAEPSLLLTLVAEKHIPAYSAWLWASPSGEAFFSKLPLRGKAMAWRTGTSVEEVLRRNPSLKPANQGTSK